MHPELISGSQHTDERGRLDFFNSLDLSEIVRMYRIRPADTSRIRAWQGHRVEEKWFYCLHGSFVVNLIPLSKFKTGTSLHTPEIYTLHGDVPQVLWIPGGYANGFKSLQQNSELLVYSNLSLEESKNDDIRYDISQMPFIESK